MRGKYLPQLINEKHKGDDETRLKEEARKCTMGRETGRDAKTARNSPIRPTTAYRPHTHSHAHKVPGVNDGERGSKMKIECRLEGRVYCLRGVRERKYVPTYYAQRVSGIIERFPSIDENKPTTSARASREGDDNIVEFG